MRETIVSGDCADVREYFDETCVCPDGWLPSDTHRLARSRKVYNPEYNHEALDSRSHAVFNAYPGGVSVKRKLPWCRSSGGGRRGVVVGFSESSKRSLRRKLMAVPWQKYAESSRFAESGRAYFITLTYPAIWSEDWQVWKRDLDVFLHRLKRRFAQLQGLIWKLEYQRRGAPHFHIVAFFASRVEKGFLRSWLAPGWFESVGSGDANHLLAGTSADPVYIDHRGVSALMAYMCKYLQKMCASTSPTLWAVVSGVRLTRCRLSTLHLAQ